QMTSVQAGETSAVHERTLAKVYEQQLVHVEGQTDILTLGIPFVCPYNPDTMIHSRSFMDQHRSELHHSNWRMGKVLRENGPRIFQIETTLNTDMFPEQFSFISSREWEWSARERATYVATTKALSKVPVKMARKIFHSIQGPHQMTSVQAGETSAVHERTLAKVYEQQLVHVEGQTDILTLGIPFVCP
ncbi:MAG: hypothetical protein ACKOYG_01260, partial [Ilumatobacteraceae bacterium]